MEESGVEESVLQAPQHSKLLEKLNTKVTIWKFESEKMADMNQPICQHCLQKVLTKHSCTTNLYSHFKKYHPELYSVKHQLSGDSEQFIQAVKLLLRKVKCLVQSVESTES